MQLFANHPNIYIYIYIYIVMKNMSVVCTIVWMTMLAQSGQMDRNSKEATSASAC